MDESPAKLHQQAISAALASNWEEALKINQQIIALDPENVEALNRIARVYFELGDLTQAKRHYDQVLKKDPYNQIAAKFLKRIKTFSKKGGKLGNHNNYIQATDLFIEEAGKTRVVTLLKVAEPQKLSLLSSGMIVNLVAKNRGIIATDQAGEYLGALPDDLSHHLLRLIKGGNKYQAIIKTIKTNSVSILIREVFRSARFRNQPSFLDTLNEVHAYSSDHIIIPDDAEEFVMLEDDEAEETA